MKTPFRSSDMEAKLFCQDEETSIYIRTNIKY